MCVKRNTYSNIGCTIKAKLFAHDAASTQVTLGPNGPRAPCSRSASVQIFGFYTALILLYVTPNTNQFANVRSKFTRNVYLDSLRGKLIPRRHTFATARHFKSYKILQKYKRRHSHCTALRSFTRTITLILGNPSLHENCKSS